MPETRTRPGQFNALGIFKLSLVFVLGSAAAACSLRIRTCFPSS